MKTEVALHIRDHQQDLKRSCDLLTKTPSIQKVIVKRKSLEEEIESIEVNYGLDTFLSPLKLKENLKANFVRSYLQLLYELYLLRSQRISSSLEGTFNYQVSILMYQTEPYDIERKQKIAEANAKVNPYAEYQSSYSALVN